MIPTYWLCGGGDNVDCQYWDDINGCWNNQANVFECPVYISLVRQQLIDDAEMDDGAGGY